MAVMFLMVAVQVVSLERMEMTQRGDADVQ